MGEEEERAKMLGISRDMVGGREKEREEEKEEEWGGGEGEVDGEESVGEKRNPDEWT